MILDNMMMMMMILMSMLTKILLLYCFFCSLYPPSSDNHPCTKVIMYNNDDDDDSLDDKNIGQDSASTSAMPLLLLQRGADRRTRVKGIQASTAVRIFWDNFCVCCVSCALHWVAVLMEWWSDGVMAAGCIVAHRNVKIFWRRSWWWSWWWWWCYDNVNQDSPTALICPRNDKKKLPPKWQIKS